jgi:hypothetical protein
MSQVNCVFIAALTSPGGTALFIIEVNGDAGIVTVKTLARPEEVLAPAMETFKGRRACYHASLLPSQTQRLVGSPKAALAPFEWKIFFKKTRLV